MKNLFIKIMPLLAVFFMIVVISACTDERNQPTKPEAPTYIETKFLLDKAVSNGEDVPAHFTVRDEIVSGRLVLFVFFEPDNDFNHFFEFSDEIEILKAEIDSISGVIFDRWQDQTLTPQDSLDLEQLKVDKKNQITANEAVQDSLDTWLDDRFKCSIRLDDDIAPLYPNAVFLDSTALDYLGSSPIAWGQGNYLAEADTSGLYGRRIELDLAEFWIADPTWRNPEKPDREEFLIIPARYPDRYTQYELLPVRNWLQRLTTGVTHTLNVRFGSVNTVTKVSMSLYLVYRTAE